MNTVVIASLAIVFGLLTAAFVSHYRRHPWRRIPHPDELERWTGRRAVEVEAA